MSLPKTELGSQPFDSGCNAGEITRDAFLDGRFTACQPKSGPRAAIDALFLAAAVPAIAGKKQRVLEAGAGSGVASLALCARVADLHVTGLEIQSALVEMARENAALNAMRDRLQFVEADLTSPWSTLECAGLNRESFDHVADLPPRD
ncbi:MAG: methyltransferase domain-containing protein, partial [Pseudomonadota bacterium]